MVAPRSSPLATHMPSWTGIRRATYPPIENLWLIGGSVLPEIPSRGWYATIVMLGHRAVKLVQ